MKGIVISFKPNDYCAVSAKAAAPELSSAAVTASRIVGVFVMAHLVSEPGGFSIGPVP
jgi:hypothetical protein